MADIHFVFDAFPGPQGPRFIEAEDPNGASISAGEWRRRPDGLVELVVPTVAGRRVFTRLLEKRIEEIVDEHGDYEPDTNYTNLPEWAETVIEELEALIKAAALLEQTNGQ